MTKDAAITEVALSDRDTAPVVDEPCAWTKINGKLVCQHGQFGKRLGLGKLYRVTNATGIRLVRAPEPMTAKAAVQGLSVERALPHEADGRADVVDTRQLIHRRPIPPTRRAQPRPWAAPEPRQFGDAPGDARPAPREWELDGDGSPTIDLVTGRVHTGDDSAGQIEGGAGPKTRPAGRAVKVGKNTLCIGPDGRVIAGQQQEGEEPHAQGPCRWDELGARHLVCLAHNRIIAVPARLSAWERVQQIFTANVGRPRAR